MIHTAVGKPSEPHLHVGQVKPAEFRSPQAKVKEYGQDCPVSSRRLAVAHCRRGPGHELEIGQARPAHVSLGLGLHVLDIQRPGHRSDQATDLDHAPQRGESAIDRRRG